MGLTPTELQLKVSVLIFYMTFSLTTPRDALGVPNLPTGIRNMELRYLEYADVDLENKTVFVRAGKGKKDRIVPMINRLVDICRNYLKVREKIGKASPYFFAGQKGSKPLCHSVFRELIVKLRKKSKLYFTAHMLRHTFAVLMLEGGCNLFALSKMMGHSDIKTTTIYLSATTAHLREQVAKHPLEV